MRTPSEATLRLRAFHSTRGLVVGCFALGLGIGLGAVIAAAVLGLGGQPRSIEAQVGSGDITACVNIYTGEARFTYPGQPANCNTYEFPLELGSGGAVAALEAQVTALEEQVPDCLSEDGNADAVFEGCNVHVLSGSGATDGDVNGEGNLIIGYDENPLNVARGGSHNLVVGPAHSYTSFGGLVAGWGNTVSGENASVSGGIGNTASSFYASVSGGSSNKASGSNSSVGGGNGNTASDANSTVGGGLGLTNTTAGSFIP